MPDVEITAGVVSSGVKTGLAEIKNYATETFSSIKSQLTGLFAAGAVEEGIRSIIEYGAHVQDLSDRFGVSTTAIQQFGNAAELNGVSLDSVAKAFGRLEVAQAKALGGNQEVINAFAGLNVTIDDLKNLTPEQIMLKIGSSSQNVADLVAVLGRGASELRTTLASLADGSDALGNAMSPGLVQKLKNADDAFKTFGQNVRIYGAEALNFLADSATNVFDVLVPDKLQKLIGFGDTRGGGGAQKPPKRKFTTPDDTSDLAGSGGAGGGVDEDAQRDQIAQAQEEAYMASLDNAQKLQEIDEQRTKLQQNLNDLMSQGGGADGDDLKIKLQLAKLDAQSATIQQQINKDKDAQDQKDDQAIDAANKKVIAAENESDVQELIVEGRQNEAELLKTSLDFDEKIREAEEAVQKARDASRDDLADANQQLADQLEIEKQITLEAQKKQQAPETLENYYKRAAKAGYTVGNTESLVAGKTGIDLSQFPKSQALASIGYFINPAAVTLATNPRTGEITDESLANAILYIAKETNNGKQNLSFSQQAGIDARANQLAAIQTAQSQASASAAANAQAAVRSQVAGDVSIYGVNNSALLQQILDQLQQTHRVITPPPG